MKRNENVDFVKDYTHFRNTFFVWLLPWILLDLTQAMPVYAASNYCIFSFIVPMYV